MKQNDNIISFIDNRASQVFQHLINSTWNGLRRFQKNVYFFHKGYRVIMSVIIASFFASLSFRISFVFRISIKKCFHSNSFNFFFSLLCVHCKQLFETIVQKILDHFRLTFVCQCELMIRHRLHSQCE